MSQLTPWLRQMIATELRSIIAWQNNSPSNTNVLHKAEETGRFNDDGSNFCAEALPHHFTSDSKAQIVEVLSTRRPVVVLISDGTTSVRAILSEHALKELETGIDDVIAEDTTGDVFSVQKATVVSTTFGPPDSFIELRIQEVQYQFHLRKLVKQSKSAVSDPEIYGLVATELTAIRQRSYGPNHLQTEINAVGGSDGMNGSQKSPSSPSSSHLPIPSLVATQIPPSASRSRSSPFTSQIATQIPNPRPRPGPSLATDGLEIENGVNLATPRGINFVDAPNRLAAARQLVAGVDTARLLQLLDKNKAASPTITTGEKLIWSELNHNGKRTADGPPQSAQPAAEPSSTVFLDLHPSKRWATADTTSPLAQESTPAQKSPQPDAVVSTVSSHQTTKRLRLPPQPYVHSYHRIPWDQKALLASLSSWLPLPPGTCPRQPNVPAALLEKRHDQLLQDQGRLSVAKNLPAESASQHYDTSLQAAPAQLSQCSARETAHDTALPSRSATSSSGSEWNESSSGDEALEGWEATQRSPAAVPTAVPAASLLPPDSTGEARGAHEVAAVSRRKSNVSTTSTRKKHGARSSSQVIMTGKSPQPARSLVSSMVPSIRRSPTPPQRLSTDMLPLSTTSIARVVRSREDSGGPSVSRSGCSHSSQRSQATPQSSPRTLARQLPMRSHDTAVDRWTPQQERATTPIQCSQGSQQRSSQGSRHGLKQPPEQSPQLGPSNVRTEEEDLVLIQSIRKIRSPIEIPANTLTQRTPSAIRNSRMTLLNRFSDAMLSESSGTTVHGEGIPKSNERRESMEDRAFHPSPTSSPQQALQNHRSDSTEDPYNARRLRESRGTVSPTQISNHKHPRRQDPVLASSQHSASVTKPSLHYHNGDVNSPPSAIVVKATPNESRGLTQFRSLAFEEHILTSTTKHPRDPSHHHRLERRKFFTEAAEKKRMERLQFEMQHPPAVHERPSRTQPKAKPAFEEYVNAWQRLRPSGEVSNVERGGIKQARGRKRFCVTDWEI